MSKIEQIKVGDLIPSPMNPRKEKDGPGFMELVESIKQKGVLEPIIVRYGDDFTFKGKYEIVAGERRFLASQAAGLATVPSIVMELTDDEAFDVMMIENLQRKDLSPRDEAETFKVYLAKHGKTGLPDLAQRMGIDVRYIRRHVEVLKLPAKVLKLWEKGALAFGHLEQFLRLKDEKEINAALRHIERREEGGGVRGGRGGAEVHRPVFDRPGQGPVRPEVLRGVPTEHVGPGRSLRHRRREEVAVPRAGVLQEAPERVPVEELEDEPGRDQVRDERLPVRRERAVRPVQ